MKKISSSSKRKASTEDELEARIATFNSEERTRGETMRTNIVMEEALVDEAQRITGIKTKAGVVHHALREVVRRSKMKELLGLQGKVEFWPGYETSETTK
jgi:Arc/MetJ family transcription regulator